MKINTPKMTGMEIPAEIKNYLFEKLADIAKLADTMDPSSFVDVEIGRTTRHHEKGDVFRAELNLNIARSRIRAESESFDLKASIDNVKDQMLEELRSKKGKKESLFRKGARAIKEAVRNAYKKL